jgi:hypothetical protein
VPAIAAFTDAGSETIADAGIDLARHGCHRCRGCLVLLRVAAPDRDVASRGRQRLRDAEADAAIAAGDDGSAAAQVEDAHGTFPFV